jgi:ElaB/YqjD/DUF883 family membrane-anchored ribosome-binding protein
MMGEMLQSGSFGWSSKRKLWLEFKTEAFAGVQSGSFGWSSKRKLWLEFKAEAFAGVQSGSFCWSSKRKLWLEFKAEALAGVQSGSFGVIKKRKEDKIMSYRPHRATAVAMQLDEGDQLMSHKPTDTPDTSKLEKPRIVSVSPSKTQKPERENQTIQDQPTHSGSVNASVLEKKLRLAESQLQQPDTNQNLSNGELNFAETMGMGAGGAGGIDKIRDMLFGGQMRDYDKRFKRLEERFAQDNINFREDIFQRLKVLEERIEGEFDSLSEKSKAERQERLTGIQDLEHEIKSLKNELNTRLTQLDEQVARDIRNLRQQTLNKFQELSLQMRQQTDNLTNLLNQEVTQLQDEKVNRTDLAAYFHDMAVRLTKNYENQTELE